MNSLADIYSSLPEAIDPKGADARTVAEADFNARHWSSPVPGPLKPGSTEHKRAVAAMFRDTFNPYKPSVIDWPKLDPATLKRVTSLPIWDIAVQTEGKARLRMAAYARLIDDPDMKDALSRNAWEENRHKEVLSRLVEAYDIKMAPEPPYIEPRDVEWAYLVTGFSECVDSFFAFGLFALARQSGFFPAELIETFEPVMQEECRHILLFANWLAWHRATMPAWKRPWFEIRVLAVWVFLAYERMGLARTMDADGNVHEQDNNFTVSGAKDVADMDISVGELMDLCLEENDRRFAGYDPRLLRPKLAPNLARFIRRFMKKPSAARQVEHAA
ncbi:ferritin-like domain-containing protein [Gluconacetobacter azotocaptans]|uniref:Ferritin-like domain-containing protein n=1 Tax=Gluconacetobacter azotocaptans TaxID=142834 RepID=A0A7W4JV02_9PROT|nr:ferritin-like domain-containing protein [Gluconacetobacter azotocaptans]MBB2191417.1 ferritin-like domain-containing protein [Gluconacetobacter azotocaptans]